MHCLRKQPNANLHNSAIKYKPFALNLDEALKRRTRTLVLLPKEPEYGNAKLYGKALWYLHRSWSVHTMIKTADIQILKLTDSYHPSFYITSKWNPWIVPYLGDKVYYLSHLMLNLKLILYNSNAFLRRTSLSL